MGQLQCGEIDKQPSTTIKEPLQNNWFGLLDKTISNQPVEDNWTCEVVQQHLTSEHVTTKKTLEEIMKDISTQVLETNNTLNLGQLLWVILDIKWYILNQIAMIQI